MEKAKDKESKTAVDERKVKELNLEVAGGKCWRGKWLRVLCFIGGIPFKSFSMKIVLTTIKAEESAKDMTSTTKNIYFSETWILPFAVLSAVVGYAIMAIVFYNTDG